MLNLDNTDDESNKISSKKRSGYEKDEDFDVSDTKNDAEFAPDPNRYAFILYFQISFIFIDKTFLFIIDKFG